MLLFRSELEFDLGGYGGAEFAVDVKNALRRAIETFRPQMDLVLHPNQLSSHANAVRLSSDAALEHVVHAKFLSDSGDGLVRALISHG